jgi:peptidoglycan/LPS O-acetylase OafA/YrhL
MDSTAGVISYRRDIDGLRAIAVLSVILFHLGYLSYGYLGVDVFFVISGYLITKIVYREVLEHRFSVFQFYLRRIRRIIPLVLFTTSVALIIGLCVMLPDDLENLGQSVVATNFFANNVLLLITTGDYWNIVNEYKPLMHTWSLGIEEQFYLIYPLIFLLFSGKRSRWILPLLLVLSVLSLFIFISSSNATAKFYSIHFRFFELSLGGVGAIVFKNKVLNTKFKLVLVFIIMALLAFNLPLPADIKLLVIVFATTLVLATEKSEKIGSIILENRVMVGIGKISFSLYMWHQIILAYTRYFVLPEYTFLEAVIIIIIIILISILSYYMVEQPFRNKKRIKTSSLLWSTGLVFIFSTCFSIYIYSIGGILKDIPELELVRSGTHRMNLGSAKRNIHIEYNARIYDFDRSFSNNDKVKILVVGNSFARDWANVLLESKYGNRIEISYVSEMGKANDLNERFSKANYIFFSELSKETLYAIGKKFILDTSKVWNVGAKNFGSNNGIFYNRKHDAAYCGQRTKMGENFFKQNASSKEEWGNRYIDLIGMVVDENEKMPVFTPDCKFISQDCTHLTHSGAVYFAQLLEKHPYFNIE